MATALLVLGMHRSGTSALAGALARLGVELGDRLIEPAPDNPTGYWENADAVAINERLLHALGSSWEDVRELPEGWRQGEAAARAAREIDALLVEFEGKPLWAIKDPRLSRTLPLWREALSGRGIAAKALAIVRAPDEVAASLAARDGVRPLHAEMLWLRTLADIEAGTRGMPRALLRYTDLLAAPETELARIASELDIQWPRPQAALRDFLEPSRRHHAGKATAGAPGTGANELFDQLAARPPWPALAGAAGKLEATLREAEAWFDSLVPALARAREANAELLGQLGAQDLQLARTQSALRSAEELSLQRLEQLGALTAQLAETERELAAAQALCLERLSQLQQLDARIGATDAGLAHAEAIVAERTAERDGLRAALTRAEAVLAQRSAEQDALAARLARPWWRRR